jgi:uncharacterized surface protein with fasciclin (FAS1) repeats
MNIAESLSKSPLDSSMRHAAAIAFVTRLFKYLVLIVLLVVTLKVVYDGYSFYLMRRSIDTELQSKKITSIEQLSNLQSQNRALIIDTLESRCAERAEIVFFRIFDAQKQNKFADYFRETLTIKDALVDEIKRLGPGIIVDVASAVAFINRPDFTPQKFREHFLKYQNNANPEDQRYKEFKEQVERDLTKFDSLSLADSELQDFVKQAQDETRNGWHLESVRALEERLNRLKEERATLKSKLADMDDIVARYNSWTEALSGGLANENLLDQFAVNIDKDDARLLTDVKCDKFNDFYKEVHGTDARNAWQSSALYRWYGERVVTFFKQPPAAQTLFVTLFLGALGGLTVNVLRLSRLGWWRGQPDPMWGEIVVSPFLGALAAFAIYLVGTAGLLLTSDIRAAQTGASPLSAPFIGLLGFLSGFLYDTAFAKVRRVGTQLFGEATDPAQSALPNDRSLAEALRGVSASLAAGLMLKYGIGSKLASESEFTLLIPSDQAVGRMSLKTWTDLNDKGAEAFDRWYKHHHSPVRVGKKDVTGQAGGTRSLKLDDGTDLTLAVEGDELKIDGKRVLIADIVWNKGVIHILEDDIPPQGVMPRQ